MNNKILGVLLAVVFASGIYLALVIAPPNSVITQSDDKDKLTEQTQHMVWYPQARALSDFAITQHDGTPFTKQNLANKWTLAFVGYTYCPDICPVTLAEINKIYPELTQKRADNPLQIWFLSVDPKRDSIERLHEYINYFNPEFVAATGPHTELFPLVRSMGMMYSLSESTDKPDYLVDHSASIVVINPDGNVVGRFKPKHIPGKLAISDVQQLLDDVPVLLGH